MDIVLNTRFNNPTLPKVPVLGFYDDFGPDGGPVSDSSLGTTSRENKPWEYWGNAWGRTAHGTADSTPGGAAAYVNAGTSDGHLTTTIHTPGTDGFYGLTFRFTNSSNYWFFRYNTISELFQVYGYANGSLQENASFQPTTSPSSGDTLSVYLQGNLIRAYFNDEEVISMTSGLNVQATHHGFWGAPSTDAQFDVIEFTPA